MRGLGYSLAGFLGAVIALLAVGNLGVVMPNQLSPKSYSLTIDLSYTDFLTVMFASATLTLAAVALVVGLVAIFTYQGIKSEARRTIRVTVAEQIKLIDARIEHEISEGTVDKLTQAIERAGQSGDLDTALQQALIAIGTGGPRTAEELDFDPDEEER